MQSLAVMIYWQRTITDTDQTARMCWLICAFQRFFALDMNVFLMTGLNFNRYVRSGNNKIFDINVSQP